MGKRLGRPKFSDGERPKLRTALDTGESRHAVSIATKIPYSTVKKHARALGYEPRRGNAATKTLMGEAVPSAFTSPVNRFSQTATPLYSRPSSASGTPLPLTSLGPSVTHYSRLGLPVTPPAFPVPHTTPGFYLA